MTFGVLVLSAVIAVISDPSATSGAPWLPHAILDPLWRGTAAAWRLSVAIAHTLRQIGAGWQSVQTLMGPLRTAQFSGKLASRGILALTAFIGIFSANLGMTDLLPIPTLDGGHLLLFGGEAIRGRPLNPRTQVFAMRSGLAVINHRADRLHDLERPALPRKLLIAPPRL